MRPLLLITALLLSFGVSAQLKVGESLTHAHESGAAKPAGTVPAADIFKLKETEFDFGRIPQGRPVTHVFELVNTSKETVSISNVQASCGCTTPEWSKEQVAPGKSTFIKVGYNAAAEGAFNKSIYVTSTGPQLQIVIRGDVYKTPSTPAPLNASIQLLKNINQ